ncbi:MAG: hypothetical protein HOA66_01620 [Candidatus Marinimicrobia bacterium]|nr:hypothetical protein [Candidatus Neomarinimicrobiota bacterium]
MKIINIIVGILLIVGCSDDSVTNSQAASSEVAFVLCEGNMNSNNASLHTLSEDALSITTGDTGNSMAIYINNLLVVNNGSSNIVIYTISSEGITEYASTIDLNGSGPREILVIDDKAYVTQALAKNIAVIDLNTMEVINHIMLNGSPEDLATDNTSLFVTIMYIDYNNGWDGSNLISQINLTTSEIDTTYEVQSSPINIEYNNQKLYITSYSWSSIIDLSSKVVNTVNNVDGNYGNDITVYNNTVYRVYNKGIISMDDELNLLEDTYIDATTNNTIYSMSINSDLIYLGVTDDWQSPDSVFVLDFEGHEVSRYEVNGASPGSFVFWKSNQLNINAN